MIIVISFIVAIIIGFIIVFRMGAKDETKKHGGSYLTAIIGIVISIPASVILSGILEKIFQWHRFFNDVQWPTVISAAIISLISWLWSRSFAIAVLVTNIVFVIFMTIMWSGSW